MDPAQVALTFNQQAIAILAIEHDFPGKFALQELASKHLQRVFTEPPQQARDAA